MTKLYQIWMDSLEELKDVRVLTCCGIMAALSVALKYTASIDIGEFIRIGFSELPAVAVAVLFGPATGSIFGGMMDILKYLIAPSGAFFPGFTLSAVINGILYGFLLYKKPVSLPRVFAAGLLSKLMVSICLNTYWLSVLYGNAFFAVLPARAATNIVKLPVDAALNYIVLRFVERIWKRSLQRV